VPAAEIVATDISAEALAVARSNAARHGVEERVTFVECDLLEHPVTAGRWDIIVSNPPYVREDEFASLPDTVRLHEPRRALVGGETGVEVIRRLVSQAVERLAAGGWLLVEIGPSTATAARDVIAATTGLEPGPTLNDLAGLPRIVQARRR
jgi:release factor glutamine methyltransferase